MPKQHKQHNTTKRERNYGKSWKKYNSEIPNLTPDEAHYEDTEYLRHVANENALEHDMGGTSLFYKE